MVLRRPTIRSLLVATLIALLAPALWFVITAETKRTPVIEKSFTDRMTDAQRQEWIEKNSKRVSIWEHAKGTPQFIADSWRSYLQASAVVFLIVLVLNSAFLSGDKNEP
jgi:hypothetical protein